jgi:hypothetical protein
LWSVFLTPVLKGLAMPRFNTKVPFADGIFDPIPAGTHVAQLVALIDLGTHVDQYDDQDPKDTPKIYLCWELLNEPKSGTNYNEVIGHQYTFSLHEKAKLRQMIKSWRGRDLAPGEEFDLSKLLGKPCLVGVGHKTKDERTFAEITSVSQCPKGTTIPPGKIKPVSWEIDSVDPIPEHAWLPRIYGKTIAEVILASHEFKDAKAIKQPAGAGAGSAPEMPDEEAF